MSNFAIILLLVVLFATVLWGYFTLKRRWIRRQIVGALVDRVSGIQVIQPATRPEELADTLLDVRHARGAAQANPEKKARAAWWVLCRLRQWQFSPAELEGATQAEMEGIMQANALAHITNALVPELKVTHAQVVQWLGKPVPEKDDFSHKLEEQLAYLRQYMNQNHVGFAGSGLTRQKWLHMEGDYYLLLARHWWARYLATPSVNALNHAQYFWEVAAERRPVTIEELGTTRPAFSQAESAMQEVRQQAIADAGRVLTQIRSGVYTKDDIREFEDLVSQAGELDPIVAGISDDDLWAYKQALNQ